MLSLLWVSNLTQLVCLCLLFSVDAIANPLEVEGRYSFPSNISEDDCFKHAQLEADKKAFNKAGLEKTSTSEMLYCSEASEKNKCVLHQQVLSYYEGGYISNRLERERKIETSEIGSGTGKECVVKMTAEVTFFKSKSDPAFVFHAELDGSPRKREGEIIKVQGNIAIPAYIHLLAWYPAVAANYYHKIVPNEFDLFDKPVLDFEIPSPKAKYALKAEFGNSAQDNELNETLIVLATKMPFNLLEKESSEDFFKRLDRIGRENWKIVRVGYSILKDK